MAAVASILESALTAKEDLLLAEHRGARLFVECVERAQKLQKSNVFPLLKLIAELTDSLDDLLELSPEELLSTSLDKSHVSSESETVPTFHDPIERPSQWAGILLGTRQMYEAANGDDGYTSLKVVGFQFKFLCDAAQREILIEQIVDGFSQGLDKLNQSLLHAAVFEESTKDLVKFIARQSLDKTDSLELSNEARREHLVRFMNLTGGERIDDKTNGNACSGSLDKDGIARMEEYLRGSLDTDDAIEAFREVRRDLSKIEVGDTKGVDFSRELVKTLLTDLLQNKVHGNVDTKLTKQQRHAIHDVLTSEVLLDEIAGVLKYRFERLALSLELPSPLELVVERCPNFHDHAVFGTSAGMKASEVPELVGDEVDPVFLLDLPLLDLLVHEIQGNLIARQTRNALAKFCLSRGWKSWNFTAAAAADRASVTAIRERVNFNAPTADFSAEIKNMQRNSECQKSYYLEETSELYSDFLLQDLPVEEAWNPAKSSEPLNTKNFIRRSFFFASGLVRSTVFGAFNAVRAIVSLESLHTVEHDMLNKILEFFGYNERVIAYLRRFLDVELTVQLPPSLDKPAACEKHVMKRGIPSGLACLSLYRILADFVIDMKINQSLDGKIFIARQGRELLLRHHDAELIVKALDMLREGYAALHLSLTDLSSLHVEGLSSDWEKAGQAGGAITEGGKYVYPVRSADYAAAVKALPCNSLDWGLYSLDSSDLLVINQREVDRTFQGLLRAIVCVDSSVDVTSEMLRKTVDELPSLEFVRRWNSYFRRAIIARVGYPLSPIASRQSRLASEILLSLEQKFLNLINCTSMLELFTRKVGDLKVADKFQVTEDVLYYPVGLGGFGLRNDAALYLDILESRSREVCHYWCKDRESLDDGVGDFLAVVQASEIPGLETGSSVRVTNSKIEGPLHSSDLLLNNNLWRNGNDAVASLGHSIWSETSNVRYFHFWKDHSTDAEREVAKEARKHRIVWPLYINNLMRIYSDDGWIDPLRKCRAKQYCYLNSNKKQLKYLIIKAKLYESIPDFGDLDSSYVQTLTRKIPSFDVGSVALLPTKLAARLTAAASLDEIQTALLAE